MYDRAVSHYLEMLKNLLAKPRYSFADATSKDVPKASGVYVISDKRMNAIIYAGRTKNLKIRLLGDHKRGNVRGSQFRKALGRNFVFVFWGPFFDSKVVILDLGVDTKLIHFSGITVVGSSYVLGYSFHSL